MPEGAERLSCVSRVKRRQMVGLSLENRFYAPANPLSIVPQFPCLRHISSKEATRSSDFDENTVWDEVGLLLTFTKP